MVPLDRGRDEGDLDENWDLSDGRQASLRRLAPGSAVQAADGALVVEVWAGFLVEEAGDVPEGQGAEEEADG